MTTYVGIGTNISGTSSISPAFPAAITTDPASHVGDYLVLAVISHPETTVPTVPGWNLIDSWTGGTGTTVDDSGIRRVSVWGVEYANGMSAPTVTLTGGTLIAGNITAFSKTATNAWSISSVHGSDSTAGTDYSAVSTASLDVTVNDVVYVATATNTDTSGAGSARNLVQTGITFATHSSRTTLTTTQGNDGRLDIGDSSVTVGSANAAITYNATYATATTTSPAGATVFVRIRETAPSATAVNLYHKFGGVVGQTVTATGSGDALSSVVTAGATAVYGNPEQARWVSSFKFSTVAAAQTYAMWDSTALGTLTTIYGSVAVWLTGSFDSPVSIVQVASGATASSRVQIGADRKIRILDSTGATVKTSTTILDVEEWYYIQYYFNLSAVAWEVRIYPGYSSSAMLESMSGTTGTFLASVNTVRVGLTAGQANVPDTYLTDLAVRSDTWPTRPVPPEVAPFPSAGPDISGIEPGSTVTITGTVISENPSPVLSWTQTAGAASIVSQSSNTLTIKAPGGTAGQTLTFSFKATAAGLTGTDNINVQVLQSTEYMSVGGALVPLIPYLKNPAGDVVI